MLFMHWNETISLQTLDVNTTHAGVSGLPEPPFIPCDTHMRRLRLYGALLSAEGRRQTRHPEGNVTVRLGRIQGRR
jgi:hypothetical protein